MCNWLKQRTTVSLMMTVVFLLTIGMTSTAFGQATSITSEGFRATQGGGGALTTVWTTGNLGNTWAEGEWVPYQLTISNVQTSYPGMVGFPEIVMEYDFTAQNDARFVDMVRSIQVGTSHLADTHGWPQGDGSPYPMTTRPQIETAQNSPGENTWTGFTLLNLPNSQVNRSSPPGFGDGAPSDPFHYFYITRQDLVDAGLDTMTNTIIIYYQLHESRSFVWFNSLQEQYDQPPTDDWGGYLYSLPAYAADSRNGSGYVPGSSGQLRVSFASGDKTVPIPIPEQLPGAVSGLKWRDQNGNGVIDGGEQTLSGWRIYVSGTLENIFFETSTLTDGSGNYSFPNLTSNVVWNVYEDAQREVPVEDNFMQTYPLVGTTLGVGTGVSHANSQYGPYAWDVALTLAIPDQANMNFGNKQCEITLYCPPDVTIDCSDSEDPSFTGEPTYDANCGPVTTSYSDNITQGNCDVDGYLYQISRMWIGTDYVGQADTCYQLITVTDSTPPVISGVGDDFSVECDEPYSFSDPTVDDDCDPDPSLTFVDDTTQGSCAQELYITRTWTATDECGNESTDSQTVHIVDTTAPVISGVGDDFSVECDEPYSFSDPSASDNCDPNPSLTFVDDTTAGSCPQELYITRTWTATDDCGNSSTASQTVHIVDTTAPVISGVGDDFSVECDEPYSFSDPTVSDNCDPNPSLTFADDTTAGSCPQELYITRTWTATDACGNSSSASQTVHIVDTTAPVISGVGDDFSVECDETYSFSDPSASDNCDPNPSLTFADDTTAGACPQELYITRTWTATDACGNSSTASQTVHIVDTTPPVITCPGDVDTDCDNPVDFGEASATDNCDPNPSISSVDDTVSTSCPLEINRTWTATDACGNSASCVQNIIVRDDTPPVITGVGDDFTVECDEPYAFSDPTASDNCDPNPSLTFADDTTAGSCPQEMYIRRIWTATDVCENQSADTQIVHIVDTTPPVISGVGDDFSVECDETYSFSDPTVSDNCDPDPSLTFADDTTQGSCPQELYITRTWTATDACGNSSTASQTVHIVDTTAPIISGVGDDFTVECDEPYAFSDPSVSDNCDPDPSLTFADDTTQGDCPQNYSITRTWTATDACGNSATASQTITVVDDVAPVLTCAPDDTIECLDDLVFTPPTGTDNCDPDFVIDTVSLDSMVGPNFDQMTYEMCWVATDACGNVSDTCCQTIIRNACPHGCTFTIGGWGSGCPGPQQGDPYSTQPGCVRDYYFSSVFPTGVTVGIGTYSAHFSSAAAIENYLPCGTTPAVLTSNLSDPACDGIGNVLLSQVLGLMLNREYSCAGVFDLVGLANNGNCYGDDLVGACGNGKFDALTVDEFILVANQVLGGAMSLETLKSTYHAKLGNLNYTATCLNQQYDECDPYAPVAVSVPLTSIDLGGLQDAALTKNADAALPTEYGLSQNHPNPFNPITQINFSLPEATHVRLQVYNVVGQVVVTLVDRDMQAGFQSVTWNASNVASGIYFYRLETNVFTDTKKMVLLK